MACQNWIQQQGLLVHDTGINSHTAPWNIVVSPSQSLSVTILMAATNTVLQLVQRAFNVSVFSVSPQAAQFANKALFFACMKYQSPLLAFQNKCFTQTRNEDEGRQHKKIRTKKEQTGTGVNVGAWEFRVRFVEMHVLCQCDTEDYLMFPLKVHVQDARYNLGGCNEVSRNRKSLRYIHFFVICGHLKKRCWTKYKFICCLWKKLSSISRKRFATTDFKIPTFMPSNCELQFWQSYKVPRYIHNVVKYCDGCCGGHRGQHYRRNQYQKHYQRCPLSRRSR